MGAKAGQSQRGPVTHRQERASDTVSLAGICADAAAVSGKGLAEVAATMSLPEVLLIIRRDQARRFEELRWSTQSRALAAASIWSKPAAHALGRFERSLRVDKTAQEKPADLRRLYHASGIPVQPIS